MDRRLELHEKLCSFIGSRNVYFQSPPSIKLNYPCIIYRIGDIDAKYANDMTYNHTKCYDVTIVDKNPDNDYVDHFIHYLSMISFDRSYTMDNLNHYVFRLYY